MFQETLTRREVVHSLKKISVINPEIHKCPDSLGLLSEMGRQYFDGYWHKLVKDASADAVKQKGYVFEPGTELALDYQDGRELEVREELLYRYHNLVNGVLQNSQLTEVPDFEEEDWRQTAVFGVFEAAETFDITKGDRFQTHATWRIRGALTRAYRESGGRLIRVPASHLELESKVRKAERRLRARNASDPTIEQVAEEVGESVHRINYVLDDILLTNPDSIHSRSQDGDLLEGLSSLPGDTEISAVTSLDHYSLRREVKRAVESLPDRERKLIKAHYGVWGSPKLMVKERGRLVGVRTGDTVRASEERGLAKVRDLLLEKSITSRQLYELEGIY